MAVFNVYKPASGQFDNAIAIVDGDGTFVNELNANAAETKEMFSDIVEFDATPDDSKARLTTVATGMPDAVIGVDEGNGVLHLEGIPNNNIIPTYDISLYDKENPPTIATGGTPATYVADDQVNIYVKFDITVTSSDVSSASVTIPLYVIKDWNEEKENLIASVQQKYPE